MIKQPLTLLFVVYATALQYTILCFSPLCFAFLQYCFLCTCMHNTRPHPHARSHANRVSGVDSTILHEAHPGVLSDSLTECVTRNANCACVHILYQTYLHFVCTPSELHFSSTHIPATTPATSFSPHHSYELLLLPALATHHLHLFTTPNCPPFQAMPLSAESKIIP